MACCGCCVLAILCLGIDNSSYDQHPQHNISQQCSALQWYYHGSQGIPEFSLCSSNRSSVRYLGQKIVPSRNGILYLCTNSFHKGESVYVLQFSYLLLSQVDPTLYFILMAVSGIFCVIFRWIR